MWVDLNKKIHHLQHCHSQLQHHKDHKNYWKRKKLLKKRGWKLIIGQLLHRPCLHHHSLPRNHHQAGHQQPHPHQNHQENCKQQSKILWQHRQRLQPRRADRSQRRRNPSQNGSLTTCVGWRREWKEVSMRYFMDHTMRIEWEKITSFIMSRM